MMKNSLSNRLAFVILVTIPTNNNEISTTARFFKFSIILRLSKSTCLYKMAGDHNAIKHYDIFASKGRKGAGDGDHRGCTQSNEAGLVVVMIMVSSHHKALKE
jgi:hypothetical protein